MTDFDVGSAYVDVLPDMDRFADELAAGLEAVTKGLAATITIKGDWSDFAGDLAAAQALADQLDVTIPVTADTSGAMSDLIAGHADAAAYAADHQLSFDLGVDDIGLLTGLAAGEAAGEGFASRDFDARLGFKVDALGIAAAVEEGKAAEGALNAQHVIRPRLPQTGRGDSGGGGGGGGMLAGIFGSPFFGSMIGSRIGVGGLGGGIPGIGAGGTLLKDMLGLSMGHLITSGVSVGSAVGGAAVGGGILGLGALGTAGVGMGTDLAGIGQAAGDIKNVYGPMQALNQAVAQFGAGSTQAAAAQKQLNAALGQFNPVARGAVTQAAATAVQFQQLFDQATGQAEKTGAQIITQAIKVGEKYLPTIGQYAAKNTKIVQTQLQPFFKWLQDPTAGGGLGIFKGLEQSFSAQLPTSIHAVTQGIELFAKVVSDASKFTGGFTTSLDKFFTKWNSAGESNHLEQIITNLIADFRQFEGFLKAGSGLIQAFFHVDAQTGQGIIATLTDGMNKLHAWIDTVSGGASLHTLFEAHKAQTLDLMHTVGELVGTVGPSLITLLTTLSNDALPVIQQLGDGLTPVLTTLTSALGPVIDAFAAGLIPVISSLSGALSPIIAALGPALVTVLGDLSQALVPVIDALGGPLASAIGALGNFLGGLVLGLSPILTALLPPLLQMVTILASNLAPVLPQLGASIGALVVAFTPMLPLIAQLVAGPLVGFLGLVTDLLTILTPLVRVVTDVADALLKIPVIGPAIFDVAAVLLFRGALLDMGAVIAKLIVGTLLPAVGTFIGAFSSGVGAVRAVSTAVGEMATATAGAAAASDASMVAMLGPIGLVAAAVVGVVAVWVALEHHAPSAAQAWASGFKQMSSDLQSLPVGTLLQMSVTMDTINHDISDMGAAMAGLDAGSASIDVVGGKLQSLYEHSISLSQQMATMSGNVNTLSSTFGISKGSVQGYASEIGLDLKRALDPEEIFLFKQALDESGASYDHSATKASNWATAIANNATRAVRAQQSADKALVADMAEAVSLGQIVLSGGGADAIAAFVNAQQGGLPQVMAVAHMYGVKIPGDALNLLERSMGVGGTISITKLNQAVGGGAAGLAAALGNLNAGALRTLSNWGPGWATMGGTLPTKLGTGMTNNQAAAIIAANKLGGAAMKSVREAVSGDQIVAIGEGIGAGLATGMTNSEATAIIAGYHLGGAAAKSVRMGAGVASPSKLTMFVGQMLVKGLIDGMSSMHGPLKSMVATTTAIAAGVGGTPSSMPASTGVLPAAGYARLASATGAASSSPGGRGGSVTLVDRRTVTVGDVASMRQVHAALADDRAATLAAIEQLVGTG